MSPRGVRRGQDEARLFPETVRKERPRHRFTATFRRSGLSFLAEKGRRVKSQCLLCVMGFFLSDQSANHRSCRFGELRTGVSVSTEFSVGRSFLDCPKALASYRVWTGGEGREVNQRWRQLHLGLASGGASGGLVLPSPSLCLSLGSHGPLG